LPAIRNEWLATTEPARFCTWHHDGTIDWPAEYRAWARATQPDPPSTKTKHASIFRIANPPNGATYLIDPTLRMQYQTLRLRADAASRVQWRVNNRPIASAEWPLVPGEHVITAVDDRGRRDSVRIVVK
jgi:membrane carboxypeptidase/penicillin-binding protein PbpC